jgi:hypothetical protein
MHTLKHVAKAVTFSCYTPFSKYIQCLDELMYSGVSRASTLRHDGITSGRMVRLLPLLEHH